MSSSVFDEDLVVEFSRRDGAGDKQSFDICLHRRWIVDGCERFSVDRYADSLQQRRVGDVTDHHEDSVIGEFSGCLSFYDD